MSKQNGFTPIAVIIALVILLVAAVAGIIFFSNKTPQPAPIQGILTVTPTVSVVLSPTVSVTSTPTPTKSYPGTTQYISPKLKVAFNYLVNQDGQKALVKESGSKIYVYIEGTSFDKGQYVEVFNKNKSDTLAEAIEKQFLGGISKTDCFVAPYTVKSSLANYSADTISYPKNADLGPGEIPAKCPQKYSESNGISYFLADSNHPDKFLFFSIGQYGISAGNNILWQDTIIFTD
ncbi:MAG: prepilin-type N-terminal cleavage/methylation domain-containing protein [Candidatus Daviesbacteria bacterium]|nr:prepilin-type N-terminal cleavage/methylation domain-containing protein [Candidatus Daviesbacteria bacterium]